MTRVQFNAAVSLMTFAIAAHAVAADKKYDPAKWEKTIAKFEAADKASSPPKGAVLFIGSSSIRMWNIKKSFPELTAINRGFGGSHIEDSTYYIERIVWPYAPKTIVLYAGDNDISWGKSPATVVAHFNAFVAKVREKLPHANFVFVPIKPSLSRWKLWPKMNEANQRIAAIMAKDEKMTYADCATPMIGKDGKPMADLFIKDGLHLSEKGYKMWSAVVGKVLNTKSQ